LKKSAFLKNKKKLGTIQNMVVSKTEKILELVSSHGPREHDRLFGDLSKQIKNTYGIDKKLTWNH
jgi:hypothetical protein